MTDSNKWFWFGIVVGTGLLIYLLAPILTPFMISAILAYMGDPIVERLVKWRMRRTWAVVVVFVGFTTVFFAALLWVIPLFERQFIVLAKQIPGYVDTIQNWFVPWLQQTFGVDLNWDADTLKASIQAHWREASGAVGTVVGYITRSGMALFGWLANLILIPVVTFYLLRDWDKLVTRIHELLPRRMEPVVSQLARSSDEVLGSFLRGQLLVMLALSIIYSLGLSLVGLDLAILIGVIAGAVSFVPYLGLIVGVSIAALAALMQFGEASYVGYVAAVFIVAQLLESVVLTPLLVGDRIGLHPVAVIFAVLAGGQLFGFFGILLALPVAAVVVVLLRYLHERYRLSHLYTHV